MLVRKVASLVERSNHRFDGNDLPSTSHFVSGEGDKNDAEVDSVNPVPTRAHRNLFAGIDESIVKVKINDLLGELEEPDLRQEINVSSHNCNDIICFTVPF